MLSLPSRKPSLPGACSGMPTGTSGSCGASSGTAIATSVTTKISENPTQLSTVERDCSDRIRRVPPADQRYRRCGRRCDRHQTARLSMHATWCGLPGKPSSRTSSSAPLQASTAIAHRGWNAHPVGGDSGLAGSPGSTRDSRPRSGIESTSACVYGMRRVADDLFGGPDLDDPAQVHHRDPVGDDAGHRQVVGHEDHRHVEAAPQVADQVEHRGGQRHVERAGRLVAQQHRRRHDGGPRQRDPLPLTAGELPGPATSRPRRAGRPARAPRRPRLGVAARDMPRAAAAARRSARRPTATASATRRRPGTPSAGAGPSTSSTWPEVGFSRPAIARSSVDLPEPLSPTRATDSPWPTRSETPRSACSLPPLGGPVQPALGHRERLGDVAQHHRRRAAPVASIGAGNGLVGGRGLRRRGPARPRPAGRMHALVRSAATATGSGGDVVQSSLASAHRGRRRSRAAGTPRWAPSRRARPACGRAPSAG